MYNAAGQIDKEQLVRHFAPLVKRIAYHLMARLPASWRGKVGTLAHDALLKAMDTAARTLVAAEIPLGALTSLLGAPIFAILLRRLARERAHG